MLHTKVVLESIIEAFRTVLRPETDSSFVRTTDFRIKLLCYTTEEDCCTAMQSEVHLVN